jgi:hypothetical protein
MVDTVPRPLREVPKIKKVTVKMPSYLKQELPTRIIQDGYNMREKSKWVVEAVHSLLANKEWEGALLSEVVNKPDTHDVFSIPSNLVNEMAREAGRVSMEKPSLNANQSTIIRAAINRRLLGFFTKPE